MGGVSLAELKAKADAMFSDPGVHGMKITNANMTSDAAFRHGSDPQVTAVSLDKNSKAAGKAERLNAQKATQVSSKAKDTGLAAVVDDEVQPVVTATDPKIRALALAKQAAKAVDGVTNSNAEIHGSSAVKARIRKGAYVPDPQRAEAHLPKNGVTGATKESMAAAVKARLGKPTNDRGR